MSHRNRRSFEEWMSEVDRLTSDKYGVSVHDLPDMCFRDAFDDNATPEEFVNADVHDAMIDEGLDMYDEDFDPEDTDEDF